MPDDKIRQIVQDEINRSGLRDAFGVANVPLHIHNGIDAPQAAQPQSIYTGIVSFEGRPFNGLPFPQGWAYDHVSTGQYSFLHNLASRMYTVVVFPLFTNPPYDPMAIVPRAGFVDSLRDNTFDVNFFSVADGSPADTAFMFVLTFVGQPGSNTWPQYVNQT